jgi:hypothetical protein
VIRHGQRFFLFNQRGHLISARLTAKGYRETGRTLLVEPTAGRDDPVRLRRLKAAR